LKLVLLPGLDGTGVLFQPLLSILSSEIKVQVIPLKQEAQLTYSEQAKYVASLIGKEEVVVLAESYSGLVAYELAKLDHVKLSHIVFVASFIGAPSFIAPIAQFLPMNIVKSGFIPRKFVGKFLFGSYASEELVNLFYNSLNKVETNVIKWRLKQVVSIPEVSEKIDIPCTYMQATQDNLVLKSSLEKFRELCSSLVVEEIDGTHFLLQTNPARSAEVLSGIVV